MSPDLASIWALPGSDHLLGRIPADRWALLACEDAKQTAACFLAADLPEPKFVLSIDRGELCPDHYLKLAEDIGADPCFCLSFEDSPHGVTAARDAGLQVIGIALSNEARLLGEADFVVPSLLSVRVLGAHPFVVLEVDAIPDIGTGAARRR